MRLSVVRRVGLALVCAAAGSAGLSVTVAASAVPSAPVKPAAPAVAAPAAVHATANTTRLADAAPTGADTRTVHTAKPVSMVGVWWSAARPDTMEVRHQKSDHSWSDWTALDASDDQPELGKHTPVSEPLWTGPTSDLQVRAYRGGRPVAQELELVTIDPGTTPTDAKLSAAARAASAPGRPVVVTRAQWGADESIMTWPPEYAATTKAVAVHHTAGTNDYTCDQSAALVRGIYQFHAVTNGWGDIGYNVLVDKCGTIFEGRTGGIQFPIIGAHAGGFNTFTFGISMLGTFTSVAPSDAQFASVAAMAAWKLGGSLRDPLGSAVLVSSGGGTARWPAGTAVTLPTIFGHRDSGFTECPGDVAYGMLDQLRNRVVQLIGDWRSDPIYQKWQALGGDNWFAGGVYESASDLAPGGRSAKFGRGDVQITWQQAAGAHWLSGPLRQRFANLGGPAALGFPTTDQQATTGPPGTVVMFGAGKAMYAGAQAGVHLVTDVFLTELLAHGDVATYGLPKSEQAGVPGRSETFQDFELASIYSNAGSLYTVGNIMRANWGRFGGYSGPLGLPAGNQTGTATRFSQRFQGGVITCTVDTGRSRCTQSTR